MINKILKQITHRIHKRSESTREFYLEKTSVQKADKPNRSQLSCANLAHGFATCGIGVKQKRATKDSINLTIINSYNDMLSAHHPYTLYPQIIKETARVAGATVQVIGGIPTMCYGLTQGRVDIN